MAALSLRDERGAVYVEFLLAFLPLFVLFLALCQISLLVAGRLVVRHAALVGARAAIVVLDDDPVHYGGAARGVLSEGAPQKPAEGSDGDLLSTMRELAASFAPSDDEDATAVSRPAQRGPRMQVIRRAALRPLSAIAPSAQAIFGGRETSLAKAVARDPLVDAGFALAYSDAATVVSIHRAAASPELAAEPILHNTPVTLRVTYLQLCAVPLVRGLICDSLGTLLDSSVGGAKQTLRKRFEASGAPGWLEGASDPGSRFIVFEAEVTLPNQGALYEYTEAGDAAATL
jgi:hypothetical protein